MQIKQLLVKKLTYPLNELREGHSVLKCMRSLNKSQFLSVDHLHELRVGKLRRLVRHAYENTSFYRQRFDSCGISPDRILDFDDLRQIPPLTKEDILAHSDEMVAQNLSPKTIHQDTSGGSTGTHTRFYRDDECLNIKLAAQFRFNQWCGWDIGKKHAMYWPAFQDLCPKETIKQRLRRNCVERMIMIFSGQLNEDVMADHACHLEKYAPSLIRAFPFPLALFAEYLRREGNYSIQPTGILTTGEPLLAKHRELFEEVFQCPIFNCYATRECGNIACECEAHEGLHINAECLHLEFDKEGSPVQAGELGEIMVTDLDNFGMPFIRYQIGDTGSPMDKPCQCGRSLPLMGFEAGRVTDFILSPHDGSLVSGSVCHELIADGPDVGQIQIIQDHRDHLCILVQESTQCEFSQVHTDYVNEVLFTLFHGSMRVTFELVESIPPAPSGKQRVCINEYLQSTDY